jgi:hypothetical protein
MIFLEHYGYAVVTFALCTIAVVYPDRPWPSTLVGGCLMAYNYYFSHRLLHFLPNDHWLNFHFWLHHDPVLPRWLALPLEGIIELGYFMLFPILIQWVTGDWVIPFSVILLLSLTYTSYHMIQYSTLKSETHGRHHKDPTKNFAPDFIDHMFKSNYDETYEDMSSGAINCLVSAVLVIWLKKHFQWKD